MFVLLRHLLTVLSFVVRVADVFFAGRRAARDRHAIAGYRDPGAQYRCRRAAVPNRADHPQRILLQGYTGPVARAACTSLPPEVWESERSQQVPALRAPGGLPDWGVCGMCVAVAREPVWT